MLIIVQIQKTFLQLSDACYEKTIEPPTTTLKISCKPPSAIKSTISLSQLLETVA